MVSLKLYYNKTFSSAESESSYVDDYEVKVVQFDVGSTSPSRQIKLKSIVTQHCSYSSCDLSVR